MNKKAAQNVSFQIISYAGDAFSYFFKAVQEAREGRYEKADKQLAMGEEQLTLAHEAQTELLAEEAQGNDIEYSILLVHAQDHLMTTIMYERVAKEFISLYKERNS
ncbi:PTS lactose/cellobiose transporter subunit IIA [Anaerostipes sp.]|uniref:PTS lactose/cellobiose transporter subunit IIA n=1 Tax=Anaerostipes sp. TaxID=1872530 RepID=UPI0025BAE0AA|nr:PTS lactose/cellobiose transporter subunit IIA [Anaerostipes sp.]MBS7009448.1 PTS lactose/cellobiose transporter subunit IIA [Anaerostipes sp.]